MTPDHADAWARGQLDRMEIAMQAHEQHDTDRFEEARDATRGVRGAVDALTAGFPAGGPSLAVQMDRVNRSQQMMSKLGWIVVVAVVGLLVERLMPHVAGMLAEPPAKAVAVPLAPHN